MIVKTIFLLSISATPCLAFLPQSAIPNVASILRTGVSIPSMMVESSTDATYSLGTLMTVPSTLGYTSSLLVSDEGGVLDILRSIAVGITAILFLLAGLTYLTASVIVPAAAKELEKECKELAPELWDEYQTKLEPGQTMGQRPDLMQELGAKIQPLLDAKIERQFAEKKEQGIDVSEDERAWKALDDISKKVPNPQAPTAPSPPKGPASSSMGNQWDDDDEAIDAEVISKNPK